MIVLLKPEKGKIFRKIIIFYSTEFFKVTIVTDRKYSVADNVVLAISRDQLLEKNVLYKRDKQMPS